MIPKPTVAVLLLALMSSVVFAGEKPVFTYEGEVAGVMCSACSSRVKGALEKLEGVKSISIVLPKSGGLPRLTLKSTSPTLTRDAAVKALGDDARMYDIRTFKLATGGKTGS